MNERKNKQKREGGVREERERGGKTWIREGTSVYKMNDLQDQN